MLSCVLDCWLVRWGYVGRGCVESGCEFTVREDELDRGAGREVDSHDPSLLTTLENPGFLAVDAP